MPAIHRRFVAIAAGYLRSAMCAAVSARHRAARMRRAAASRLLRRQRGLPLPRPGVRGAAVRARRRARGGVAADRRRRARLRALAPAVARAGAADRGARRCSSQWGVVLALMNCCFYEAIDRLPLGTVAAIEFLPVIALAALGARTPRNAAALALAVAGVYLLTGVRLEGEPLGRRVRVRQRRSCSRSTSCSPTAWRATRRSPGSTGSALAMLVAAVGGDADRRRRRRAGARRPGRDPRRASASASRRR